MKLCALVIGHKKSSPGAMNQSARLTEFDFNEELAFKIEQQISKVNIQRVYRRTFSTLPSDINELEADFIISLHCNAFNKTASGTETLYYHRSKNGKLMAEILNNQLVSALNLKNRGIKAKTSEDRGGSLLKNTLAPCVIAEPFFIDNDSDLEIAISKQQQLIRAYVEAIETISTLF